MNSNFIIGDFYMLCLKLLDHQRAQEDITRIQTLKFYFLSGDFYCIDVNRKDGIPKYIA